MNEKQNNSPTLPPAPKTGRVTINAFSPADEHRSRLAQLILPIIAAMPFKYVARNCVHSGLRSPNDLRQLGARPAFVCHDHNKKVQSMRRANLLADRFNKSL